MSIISDQVARARAGDYPYVICRMPSGWAVMGETQVLPGYCLLLPDPVVPSLNDLSGEQRARYLDDMARLGDAVLQATGARRINYEILGNLAPELHAHVIPRYADEPTELRTKPIWFYDWQAAAPYAEEQHGELRRQLQGLLASSPERRAKC